MNDPACILFLDFDGVTHPEPSHDSGVFSQMPLIEQVLLQFPRVGIVISSSWREQYRLDQLREFFRPELHDRVLGVTPDIAQPDGSWTPGQVQRYERQWECENWLRRHQPRDVPWVAIDDRAHWFEPECRHLLLTDRRLGFQADDALRLQDMLQERLP